MKLCFSTLGCPEWDMEKVITSSKSMGYNAIEIRGIAGEMQNQLIPALNENMSSTKDMLYNAGLSIVCIGSSASLDGIKNIDENMADAKNTIDTAAKNNVPYVRVFGNNIADDGETNTIHRVGKYIRQLCQYGQDKNVEVLLETHGEFNTTKRVLAVAELADSPNFGILWDVAHTDESYGDDWRVFYDKTKHLIRHVHLKDHHRSTPSGEKYKLCLTGEGDIPLHDIISSLEKDGYNGALSLEWEKKWHKELQEPETAFPQFVEYMKIGG